MGTWDESKERQFLMCIIHVQSISAPDWNAVAEVLNGATGEKFSGNALRQKFDKMKKAAKEELGELPTADGEGGVTPTPKKRGSKKDEGSAKKSAAASSKRKTPSKKSAAAVVTEEEDGEDDGMETPTKNKKIKTEVGEGEGESEGDQDGLLT